MTREEEINKAAIEYGEFVTQDNLRRQVAGYDFAKGVKWADENPKCPWISVKDDLPCNHEELIEGVNTKRVIIYTGVTVDSNRMNYIKGKWQWFGGRKVTHWMPIPEPPKE